MLIAVTEDHIQRGKRINSCKCPVALAINEQLDKDFYCSVSSMMFQFYHIKGAFVRQTFVPPINVTRFVVDYDCERPVAPFTFEMEIPDKFTKNKGRI